MQRSYFIHDILFNHMLVYVNYLAHLQLQDFYTYTAHQVVHTQDFIQEMSLQIQTGNHTIYITI